MRHVVAVTHLLSHEESPCDSCLCTMPELAKTFACLPCEGRNVKTGIQTVCHLGIFHLVEKGRLVSGPLFLFRVEFTWVDQGLYTSMPGQQIIQGIAYSENKNTMKILVSSSLYILALILSLWDHSTLPCSWDGSPISII